MISGEKSKVSVSQVVLLIQKMLAFLGFDGVIHMSKGRPKEAPTYQTPGEGPPDQDKARSLGDRADAAHTAQHPSEAWAGAGRRGSRSASPLHPWDLAQTGLHPASPRCGSSPSLAEP